MRILLISEFFPSGKDLKFSGGVETRTFFIAKYLARKHRVIVLAARTTGTKAKERLFGFTILRIAPTRSYKASAGDIFSRIRFIKNSINFGKSQDVDIVDGGNYICHFIAKQIANNKKIPVVAWYPDVWLNSWLKNAGFYGLLGELLERFNLARGFNTYIAISKQTANKLKKYAKNKLEVIPCGVEKKEFERSLQKFTNPTILCVSRLTRYKNIKTLILGFAHLSARLKNARLVIVGTGPQEKYLKSLVKSLNISSKVKFYSTLARKDLIKLYKSSHVFSLSSFVEGFGISIIEAAAAGLPYVASDIAVFREITRNGQGGFLVDLNDPLAFSEKFYNLINNQSLYKKKSREVQSLSKTYSWHQIAQKTESVYMKAMNKYNKNLRRIN